jgi:hypothetical protein
MAGGVSQAVEHLPNKDEAEFNPKVTWGYGPEIAF